MSIRDVQDSIVKQFVSADPKSSANADRTLAAWISLIDTIDKSNFEGERLSTLVSSLSIALFKEIHISLILSQTDNDGSASVLARGCIEKAVYILYFADHPITAYDWALNGEDLNFNSILQRFQTKNYFALASGASDGNQASGHAQVEELRKIYRYFSEFVHGKYRYLETVADVKELRIDYHKSLKVSAQHIETLFHLRFGKGIQ